jgi:signal transduction histidine kinase
MPSFLWPPDGRLLYAALAAPVATFVASLASVSNAAAASEGIVAMLGLSAAGTALAGVICTRVRRTSSAAAAERAALAAEGARLADEVRDLRAELAELRDGATVRDTLLAQERDANRLKDAFLSAMAHELREPLRGITGWIHVLSSSRPDEPTFARGIAALARDTQTLTRAIAELVDVSHVVTGTMQLTFDLIDLRAPIRAALDLVRPAAHAKLIVLDVHLPSEPCYITGDRDRLQHVIGTLLSNAIRSTQMGGVVSVIVSREGDEYRVDLMDTGLGVSPDVLTKPFERSQSLDGGMAREHGGVSLCLAVVKELAELHGGSVNASPERTDDGSAIAIRLPALTNVRSPEPHEWSLRSSRA